MLCSSKIWAYEYKCIFALIEMKQYIYSIYMYIYIYDHMYNIRIM